MTGARRTRTFWLATLALALAGPVGVRAQPPAASHPVVITQGESVLRRAPDRAIVDLAVESRAATPTEAQQRNAGAMKAVQERLTALGLPASAVQTVSYNLQQEFDYQDGKQTPRDFLAAHTLEVTVDDINRVGSILDAAVQTGATTIRGIRYDLRDRAAVEHDALKGAVADARARAEAMAAGAGGRLGRIVRLESTSTAQPAPRPFMSAVRAGAPDEKVQTPIATGEIEIRGEVRLTAELLGGDTGGH
jgi:uncharacterized protein YggE